MLTFVGLGLYDEKDITLKGLEAVQRADKVYAEFYTSQLTGTTIKKLEEFHGKEINVLSRKEVEETPEFIEQAKKLNIVFLSAGDAMISTTHVDLRLRASEKNIDTMIIHGPSIQTSVVGLTGLQNYRFGKSTTLPFKNEKWKPKSPYEVILGNLERDLHTLIFLDIDISEDSEEYMSANQGAEVLSSLDEDNKIKEIVAVARAGSESPKIFSGTLKELEKIDLGPPLHVLVVPASLHHIERKSLEYYSIN